MHCSKSDADRFGQSAPHLFFFAALFGADRCYTTKEVQMHSKLEVFFLFGQVRMDCISTGHLFNNLPLTSHHNGPVH